MISLYVGLLILFVSPELIRYIVFVNVGNVEPFRLENVSRAPFFHFYTTLMICVYEIFWIAAKSRSRKAGSVPKDRVLHFENATLRFVLWRFRRMQFFEICFIRRHVLVKVCFEFDFRVNVLLFSTRLLFWFWIA